MRRLFYSVVCICVLGLSGCGGPFPQLDEDEVIDALNTAYAKNGCLGIQPNPKRLRGGERGFPIMVSQDDQPTMARMRALEGAGILVSELLEDNNNDQVLWSFNLSPQGRAQRPHEYSSQLCVCDRVVDELKSFTEWVEEDGFIFSDVDHSYKSINPRAWTEHPEVVRHFPEIRTLLTQRGSSQKEVYLFDEGLEVF